MPGQFPRRPDQKEKRNIVDIMFPDGTNPGDIDFTHVWLLSPMEDPTAPDFNCFGWGLLVNEVIPPNYLGQCNYTAAHALEQYNAPNDCTPTSTGAKDAVVRFWGYKGRDYDTVNHVSRFVNIDLLKDFSDKFGLNLNFGAPSARGFPREIWSSKRQQGRALFTHPKDWLEGSRFGVQLEDLKVTEPAQMQKSSWEQNTASQKCCHIL